MNKYQILGWIDTSLLTNLNRGGKTLSSASFCIDDIQRRLSARIRVESRLSLYPFRSMAEKLINH